jgi:hypothetical protein
MENESSPALNAVAEMLRASRISKDEAEKLESKYRLELRPFLCERLSFVIVGRCRRLAH